MKLEWDDLLAGSVAGSIAGAAFLAAMKVDQVLTNHPLDDVRLLGEIGPWSARWRLKGTALHFVNSAVFGALYSRIAQYLVGPPIARGMTFALAENTVLWPFSFVVDRRHPAVRSGTMPPMNTPISIALELERHVVYGVVLGVLYEPIRALIRRQ